MSLLKVGMGLAWYVWSSMPELNTRPSMWDMPYTAWTAHRLSTPLLALHYPVSIGKAAIGLYLEPTAEMFHYGGCELASSVGTDERRHSER